MALMAASPTLVTFSSTTLLVFETDHLFPSCVHTSFNTVYPSLLVFVYPDLIDCAQVG